MPGNIGGISRALRINVPFLSPISFNFHFHGQIIGLPSSTVTLSEISQKIHCGYNCNNDHSHKEIVFKP